LIFNVVVMTPRDARAVAHEFARRRWHDLPRHPVLV
jgi:hypothetical protein